MDIKKWFEDGTKLKIKELRYLKMPNLPYNIYVDDRVIRGADKLNNIIVHNVTIEHYSKSLNDEEEFIIDKFLNKKEIHYEKSSDWLQEENIFVTIFELDPFFEKIGKEN